MTTTPEQAQIDPAQAEALRDLINAGKVPFKLTLGTQTSQGINFEPGSINVAENATAVFVCG